MRVRRRRDRATQVRQPPPAVPESEVPTAQVPLAELRAAADAALVETDTAILTSRSELEALRSAQGAQACAPFSDALAAAANELNRAIELRNASGTAAGGTTKDSGTADAAPAAPGASPGGPDEGAEAAAERARLERIITLCDAAQAFLDEQAEAFDTTRDLEHRVEALLSALTGMAAALAEELQRAAGTVADLRSRYPAMALAALQANLTQADERLRMAADAVQAGARDLADPDRRWAVARALAAEECLRQAQTLIAGVQKVPGDVALAEGALSVLLTDTEEGIAEAQALGEGRSATELFAQNTVEWAKRESDAGQRDPLATRRALEDTGTALSMGLAPRRAAKQARERALELLDSATSGANSSLRMAACFISTRRGVVGAEARSRLAQATSLFEQASGRRDEDPPEAVSGLRRADALAEQALQMAQQDEARAQNQQRMIGTDPRLVAALIGGILVPLPAGAERAWAAASFGGRATRGRWALPGLD